MIQRTLRLPLNGFFVNVKIDGKYQMFPLINITEDGIGIRMPKDVDVKQGKEYELRYNVPDPECDVVNIHKDFCTHHSECVSAMGKVVRISEKNEKHNIVGFELDYVSIDEEIDVIEKVGHARNFVKRRLEHPEIHTQFKLMVLEPERRVELKEFHIYEGIFAVDKHRLQFFIHADYEHLFFEGDAVTVDFPIPNELGKDYKFDGEITDNEKYNMCRNLITVNLDLDTAEEDKKSMKEYIRDYIEDHEFLMKFS